MTGKIMPPLLLDVVVVFARVAKSPGFSSITSCVGDPWSLGFTKLCPPLWYTVLISYISELLFLCLFRFI